MADVFPPNGFDRADGTNGIGTPEPADAIAGQPGGPNQTFFEEDQDSPQIEIAEQCTITHRGSCSKDYALSLAYGINRGAMLTDSNGIVSIVLNNRLSWNKLGRVFRYEIVSESISFNTPPPSFRLEVIELNPALEKHPRYAFLTATERQLVNNAASAGNILSQEAMKSAVSTITDATHKEAALELLTKRVIGEDTFYLPGFRICFSEYFWHTVELHPGGVIQDPILDGGIPPYFWDPSWPDIGTGSVFDRCYLYNPQFYSEGISWLRMADDYEWERTWFKVTHTWQGAPYAHWDADLYSNAVSPYPPPPLVPVLS